MGIEYSGPEICATLQPKTRCIRARKRTGAQFDSLCHKHIPEHRINADDIPELLKALAIRFGGSAAEFIVGHYLNERGGKPEAHPLRIEIYYPEPGVTRQHCGAGDIDAWLDTVTIPQQFRI